MKETRLQIGTLEDHDNLQQVWSLTAPEKEMNEKAIHD